MNVEIRHEMRGGKGDVTLRHLFGKQEFTAGVRLCARLTLPPGAGIGMHRHDNEDELFVFVKGSGLLDDGRTVSRVQAGDASLTVNGESHSLSNDGPEDLEAIAVIITH